MTTALLHRIKRQNATGTMCKNQIVLVNIGSEWIKRYKFWTKTYEIVHTLYNQ